MDEFRTKIFGASEVRDFAALDDVPCSAVVWRSDGGERSGDRRSFRDTSAPIAALTEDIFNGNV